MPKKKKITTKDLYRFQFVSDARLSPDGETVLFTLTRFHPDREKDTYESHITCVRASGGAPFPFTSSNDSESHPRFSPDGSRILFLSARNAEEERKGKTQIWVMPTGGGEGRRVTSEKRGAANPEWSPDGKSILFAGRVPVDPKEDRLPREKRKDALRIRRLSWRMNGLGNRHDYFVHLFVVPARGGKPRQITSGEWNVIDAAFSPDGERVYFTANIKEEDHTHARDLYSVPVKGGRLRKLCGLPGPVFSPAPSPDGRLVAFVGHDFSRSYATNQALWVVPAGGGDPENLTADWNGSIGQSVNSDARAASPGFVPIWSPDGTGIRFLATVRGATRLFNLDVATREVLPLSSPDRSLESWCPSADFRSAAFTFLAPTELAEVWIEREGRERALTRFNRSILSRLELAPPRKFSFRASDGAEVDGWILLPPGSRRRRHPAILEIHGGPRTAYGLAFMHEFQLLAAAGFAVFYVNPRGSSSYGEEWAYAVARHYGERDYEDVMEAVDHVVATEPIDPDRIGVTGGSYGGFLTNWIVGHTDRFRAACTQRSISNWLSFFGTSDIGYRFAREEVGGVPWEQTDEYWKRSPLAYAGEMKTPLLIVHSEEDWRCPVEQAEQLFAALAWQKRDVELLRFPGENHELSRSGKPRHRIERLDAIVDWFQRKLRR